ncbi:MAG: hypothetical protein DHS20C02_09390 [Micavibrio sp.]|nr:MAG: hypothetical protein DHS20C02_09390 [Micavibrio sp.]
MGESFFQTLKWFISTAFIIGGIAALSAAERTGSIPPLMLAIFSFGGAYIMSGSWRALPGKAIFISFVFVGLCGVAARYVPGIMRVDFGIRLDINFYYIWLGLVFFIGLPLMTVLFRKMQE